MSNSNGTQTLVKSMNGILSFDTGGGVIISGDTIVAGNIDLQNLSIDNIQGITPDNDITLFTDTSALATIQIGGATTGLTFIDGNVAYINGTNTVDIFSGSLMDVRSPTMKLNYLLPNSIYMGDVKIQTNTIEPNTLANGLSIGSTITSANLTLGNATYPPSCTATATSANHICNYSTVQALISAGGGGSLLSSNNVWSGTNRFNSTVQLASIFQTDSIDPLTTTSGTIYYLYGSVPAVSTIYFGSITSGSTSQCSINPNNGVVDIGLTSARTASVNINSGATCSGDVNILTGTNNTGDFNVGTSLTYGGDIRFSTGTGSVNTFTVGTVSTTTLLLRGNTTIVGNSYTNINTGANASITTIGNSGTPSTTNILGIVNIGTSGGQNTNIGHITAQTNILGSPLNLNNTLTQNTRIGALSNTGTITIGNASSTALEIGKPMTPIYTTYTVANGTNVADTIGYVISGSYTGGGALSLNSREISVINIPDNGVYIITYTQSYLCATNGTLQRMIGYIQIVNNGGGFQAEGGISTVFGALTTAQIQSLTGSFTYTITGATSAAPWRARCLLAANITSGTYNSNSANFSFTAVRIA